jgi:2-oxoisovalerate dehydrogenase E1 component
MKTISDIKDIISEVLTIRAFEKTLLYLYQKGMLGGTVHTCIGQEINPVVISKFKLDGDYVISNHRGHGHYLAFNNFDYEPILKEILGRNDGCSNGIGGSQHLSSQYFLSNGIQGGMSPIATGMAYGLKYLASKSTKNIVSNCVFIFIGDGTLGQGVLYEALNISGLFKLPIIFILEDNGIAQSTPKDVTLSGNIKTRIEGFGINYNYIRNMYNSINDIKEIVHLARSFEPQFIHIQSNRLMSHSKGDDNRDKNFISSLSLKDPFENILSQDINQNQLLNKQNQLIDEAIKLASDDSAYVFEGHISENIDFEESIDLNTSDKRYNVQINESLIEFMDSNSDSLIIGEDIRDTTLYPCNSEPYGGAFRVTLGLSSKYESRVINFPISEQEIVGFSTGYSLINNWTICEIMFADFLTLTVDQVLQHISKFKEMLGKKHFPKVIIRTPIGGYRGYGPTHSQCIENLFLGIPNFNVFAMNKYISPNSYYKFIQHSNTSALLLENKILYTENSKPSNIFFYELITSTSFFPVVYFKSKYLTSNLLVITYGQMITLVEQASEDLLIENEIGVDCLCFSDLNNFKLSTEILNVINQYKNILILTESKTKVSWASHFAFILKSQLVNKNIEIMGNDWIIPASVKYENQVLPSKTKIIKWATLNS